MKNNFYNQSKQGDTVSSAILFLPFAYSDNSFDIYKIIGDFGK